MCHRSIHTRKLRHYFLTTLSICLGMFVWYLPAAATVQTRLTPEELRTPGIYSVENGTLVSVAAGRVATSLGTARAERLAGEQALRNARYQLALHLYKDQLSGPMQYSVKVDGARIIFREKHGNSVFVALRADPAQVFLVPRSPLENFHEVTIAPVVDTLLTRAPIIADGGGTVFDVDGGWVGLGVGYAALPDKQDTDSLRKARTVARMAAVEALTNFIFGMQVDVNSEHHEIYASGPGGDLFKEWAKNSIREEIVGTLKNAQTAGEWFTDDAHIGVAIIIARPSLDIAFEESTEATTDDPGTSDTPLLYKSDIPEIWQRNIAARPWVKTGGVTICKHEGALYALAVENGKLQGNAAYDRMQLPTLIDTKARAAITGYLVGFSGNYLTQSEEIRRTDLTGEEVTESLNKISSGGVTGIVSGIQRLGSWYSEDEKNLFQAFIVPLP